MRTLLVAALLVLVVAAPLAHAEDTQPPLHDLVPAGTLALVEFDDLGGTAHWKEHTALGRLWAEPEMQGFLSRLDQAMREGMKRAAAGGDPLAMFGLTMADFEALEPCAGGIALVDVTGGTLVDFVAMVEFRRGNEEWGRIVKAMRDGLATFLGLVFEDVTIQGGAFHRIRPAPGMELVFGMHGNRFWLANSVARIEKTLAGAPGASLGQSAAFRQTRERMGADRYTVLAWADAAALSLRGLRIAETRGVPERKRNEFTRVWNALGLDALQCVAMADVPSGDGFRTEFAATVEERRGLFALAQEGPVSGRFAHFARPDVLVYAEERWDPAQGWETILSLVRAVEPRAHKEMLEGLAEARGYFGFDLVGELLASVGDEYAWSVGMPAGGGAIPDVTVWLSLRDAARFEKAVLRMLDVLRGEARRERLRLEVRSTTFREQTIRFVELSELDGDPVPFVPAWSVQDDHVVLGLWPQTVKHAITPTQFPRSLAVESGYQAVRTRLPESATSVLWLDTARLARWAWNSVVPLMQMVQGGLNGKLVPFEVRIPFEDLPTADVVAQHLGGMMVYSAVDARSVRFGWVSPYGVTGAVIPMGMAGAAVAAMVRVEEQSRAEAMARIQAERDRAAQESLLRRREAERAQREQALAAERMERERLERQLRDIEAQVAELRKLVRELEEQGR